MCAHSYISAYIAIVETVQNITLYIKFHSTGSAVVPKGSCQSLVPRLSVPDFVSQLWRKSGEPGRVLHVIRWHVVTALAHG